MTNTETAIVALANLRTFPGQLPTAHRAVVVETDWACTCGRTGTASTTSRARNAMCKHVDAGRAKEGTR